MAINQETKEFYEQLKADAINDIKEYEELSAQECEAMGEEPCPYDDHYIESAVDKAIARLDTFLDSMTIETMYGQMDASYRNTFERSGSELQIEVLLTEVEHASYLFAHSVLGSGVGLWEVFSDLPCLNTLC